MTDAPDHKLRWYQYKLSSLFILTALVAIACSWYATQMHNAAKRRVAIAEIEKLEGGHVRYYDGSNPDTAGKPPRWFSWLRKLHGDEYLGNAVTVTFWSTETTDAGLVHLKGLTSLESLLLFGTQITDAGLEQLKGLTKLQELLLFGTQITDAGLVHLKGLTKLKYLQLTGTQITDAGLVHLKDLPNLTYVNLKFTKITDAGLVHLEGLTKLEELDLRFTQVTDEGVKKLQQALPNCGIAH